MNVDGLVQLLRKMLQLTYAEQRKLDVYFSRELMPETTCASSCGPGADHAFLFKDNQILKAPVREMICNAQPNNASTDNYNFSRALHLG